MGYGNTFGRCRIYFRMVISFIRNNEIGKLNYSDSFGNTLVTIFT